MWAESLSLEPLFLQAVVEFQWQSCSLSCLDMPDSIKARSIHCDKLQSSPLECMPLTTSHHSVLAHSSFVKAMKPIKKKRILVSSALCTIPILK